MNVKTILIHSAALVALLLSGYQLSAQTRVIPLSEGEMVWGGRIADGSKMPYSAGFCADLKDNGSNQVAPLLLTSNGVYVWCDQPFSFEIKQDGIVITDALAELKVVKAGDTLKDAFMAAEKAFFPANGQTPPVEFFRMPQYNTWIELMYDQNQKGVIDYAKGIRKNGLPAGIIMIDDTWQDDYGKWLFDPAKFPDPKKMIRQLHSMGFKVMLWVCPFVSMDQYQICQEIIAKDGFLKSQDGNPYPVRWWNGTSAVLDLTSEGGRSWFDSQLTRLTEEYGVDGFKLDAGDFDFYPSDAISSIPDAKPWEQCELFVDFSTRYPYNELRAGWKNAGKPIVQRLHDKDHSWSDLAKLIPEMMAESLMGFSFCCPDMVGGGNFATFLSGNIDQDLVVRSAQIHALMPMMQFSLAPWRVLDKNHYKAVLSSVRTREQLLPVIERLTNIAAKTGEPVVAPMEFHYSGQGFAAIVDQFMLGSDIVVAPMVSPGTTRTVVLPEGEWLSDLGETIQGGRTIEIDVPIDRLPYFVKQ